MGKLIRNGIEYGGGNGTDIFEVTQAEYDALVQAGTLVHNALYVITDAPNLNETAKDISYDGSTDTVWDKVEAVDGKVNAIGTIVNGTAGGGSMVFTRTWSSKASITLTKGVWVLTVKTIIQQDNNGYRAMNIATTQGDNTPQCIVMGITGNLSAMNMTIIQNVTSTSTTFYWNCVHNSTANSELSIVSWSLTAVKIA